MILTEMPQIIHVDPLEQLFCSPADKQKLRRDFSRRSKCNMFLAEMQLKLKSVAFRLLYNRNSFDLTQNTLREGLHCHAGAGRFADEIFLIDSIERGKISNICNGSSKSIKKFKETNYSGYVPWIYKKITI